MDLPVDSMPPAAPRLGTWVAAIRRCVSLVAIVVAISWGVARASTVIAPAQYGYEKWTAENGLPQNGIRGITQTPDGYLWIATMDGLARFDGVRFTVFNKTNTAGITSNFFSAMVQGQQGDLWLIDLSGGLTRYHRGAFHSFTAEDGLATGSVRGITNDELGNVWILSEDNILKWNGSANEFVDVTPQNSNLHYESLDWDNPGLWSIDRAALHIFSGGRFRVFTLPSWLQHAQIWDVALDPAGRVWIETLDERQAMIAPDGTIERPDPAAPRPVSYNGPHGHAWVVRVGRRLSRSLEFEPSNKPTILPLALLFNDREGNIWIGTEGSGLYKLQEQSIHVYSHEEGLPGKNVYPIYQDRSGTVWLGLQDAGLSSFRDGRFTNFGTAQGLPGSAVTAITSGLDDEIWIGVSGTLRVFRKGKLEAVPGIAVPEHSQVQALLQDQGGTLWIGTSQGLVVYRNGPSRTLTMPDGLATNDVRTIVESPAGDIWLGGYGGLTRMHNGQFTRWTERDGLPSENIRALFIDGDGVLWIGTYDGGLGRLKDGRFTRYREQDGLFNNGVFQILEDGRGNLWMSSNRGIYRVNKADLNSFAAGSLANITSVAYGESDGMRNMECNGGRWPAGIRAQDGTLWFATQDGAAVVDPGAVSVNPQPPPVVIERALLNQSAQAMDTQLTVSPKQRNLEIEYTALSFVHSEQIHFRYRLEGLETDWVNAGFRRTAYYSNLPPGTYQFHVIAENSDGVWNTVGQSLTVRVLPPFYRTWWFTALEAMALIALAVIVVRFRSIQLSRALAFSRQLIAAQENERKRIAAELHDSLGQRLVVINNLALFSVRAQEKAGGGGGIETLKEISSEASSAIRETREISYNLRPFQLDRLGLTKAVEAVVRAVGAASGITISSSLDNIDDAFPEELRIHFYRIVQECLNNMMKHAQATNADVRVVRSGEKIVLTIRDDGTGLSSTSRANPSSKSGFGMTGLKQRAQSLTGELRIRSTPGEGTELRFEFAAGGNEVG